MYLYGVRLKVILGIEKLIRLSNHSQKGKKKLVERIKSCKIKKLVF